MTPTPKTRTITVLAITTIIAFPYVLLFSGCASSGKLCSGEVRTFFVGDVPIEMVFVEGGTFMMGCPNSEGRNCDGSNYVVHQVTLSNFYIGKYPVTQEQWIEVMGTEFIDRWVGADKRGDNIPMHGVNWKDAQRFISRLNSKTGKKFRLLTEAEWEYAARGGLNSNGYRYSGSNNIDDVAWYKENSDRGTGLRRNIQPVGEKQANELGVYDMSGNVTEWVADWYIKEYTSSPKRNPKRSRFAREPNKPLFSFKLFPNGLLGPHPVYGRVLRGGCWFNVSNSCLVFKRAAESPKSREFFIGFRLAMNAPSRTHRECEIVGEPKDTALAVEGILSE